MYIILGANGHIGSVVSETLIKRKEQVIVVLHSAHSKEAWEKKGAIVEIVDVHDTAALHSVFNRGTRLFLLNPPADPSTDTVKEERVTVHSIIKALESSKIKKVVAISAFGARKGTGIGDLGVLYEMEEALAETSISATVIRAAYYMTNWDMSLATAKKDGTVHTLYPADFKIPMVAPADIGKFAASRLTGPIEEKGIFHIQGPGTYSAADVAEALGQELGKKVEVVAIPEKEWIPTLEKMNFSSQAAKSMATMTKLVLDKKVEAKENVIEGDTTLGQYIKSLVNRS